MTAAQIDGVIDAVVRAMNADKGCGAGPVLVVDRAKARRNVLASLAEQRRAA